MKLKWVNFLAPDDGAEGGAVPARSVLPPADEGEDDLRFKGVDLGIDVNNYAFEGEEGNEPPVEEPEETRGKTRQELLAELEDRRAALDEEKSRASSGSTALAEALKGILPPAQNQPAQVIDGFRMGSLAAGGRLPNETDDAFKRRLEEAFVQDPVGASQRQIEATLGPVLALMTENTLQMNRELVQRDPELGKVYGKYPQEIEAYVAAIPPALKIKNPRAYQEAARAVKAAHGTEFLTDEIAKQVQEGVATALKQLGIDPEALKKAPEGGKQGVLPAARPSVGTLASPIGSRPQTRPAGGAKTVIPQWFRKEMAMRGFDDEMIISAYEDARRNGQA